MTIIFDYLQLNRSIVVHLKFSKNIPQAPRKLQIVQSFQLFLGKTRYESWYSTFSSKGDESLKSFY